MTAPQRPRCPMCGRQLPPPKATGRRAVYCTPACRKAAYDARRGRQPAAFEVKVIDHEHDLDECVRRVLRSPGGIAEVLLGLSDPTRIRRLNEAPSWGRTKQAFAVLLDVYVAMTPKRR